jgi:uncharacterized protein
MSERLFLDTAFVQALFNKRDKYHQQARTLLPRVKAAAEVWTTEAILVEVGNALSDFDRASAVRFIRQSYNEANMRVVGVDTALLIRGLALYESRPDKSWGLTDCISFVVMAEQGLSAALTADRDFVQAGYQVLFTS